MSTFRIASITAGLAGILLSVSAMATATRAGSESMADRGGSDSEHKCLVHIDRQFQDGTYRVVRQEWEVNGKDRCRCYVQTGQNPQSETTERAIADLLRDRECDDAALIPIDWAASGVTTGGAAAGGAAAGGAAAGGAAAGGAAAGAGGLSTAAIVAGSLAALGGGVVLLSDDSNG